MKTIKQVLKEAKIPSIEKDIDNYIDTKKIETLDKSQASFDGRPNLPTTKPLDLSGPQANELNPKHVRFGGKSDISAYTSNRERLGLGDNETSNTPQKPKYNKMSDELNGPGSPPKSTKTDDIIQSTKDNINNFGRYLRDNKELHKWGGGAAALAAASGLGYMAYKKIKRDRDMKKKLTK